MSAIKLRDRSVHDLLAAFRSSDPTPGGGSASALSGAIGASLLAMVAGLAKPAAQSAEDLADLKAAGARSALLAERLETLIDGDSEAYESVVGAYKLPRATEDEKALRAKKIQDALRTAIEAPLDVMRACASGLEQGSVIARQGNPNASSDVHVGLELLRAGLKGARLNVEINLGGIKDREYAEAVQREIALLDNSQPATPNFQR
jgi:formiminotetrahydrofolate cyclodeaminase